MIIILPAQLPVIILPALQSNMVTQNGFPTTLPSDVTITSTQYRYEHALFFMRESYKKIIYIRNANRSVYRRLGAPEHPITWDSTQGLRDRFGGS